MPVLEALNPDKTQPTAMRSFSNFLRKRFTTSYMEDTTMDLETRCAALKTDSTILTTPLTRISK